MNAVRSPAVAGTFYPESSAELGTVVRGYLANVTLPADSPADSPTGTPTGTPAPKAIIAPHAGYIYSGAIAASAYARLIPAKDTITRVILLGPCHRVPVRGLAASSASAFATPLGDVPIDKDAFAEISHLPQVSVVDETHAEEHSLEVHLPFLQEVLGDFTVLPLVVGDASNDQVAEVLDILWGGPETIIVISSDLSHFLDYNAASDLDRETCTAIEALDPDAIRQDQACGRVPVKGLLTTARRRSLRVETIDLKNSGDTAGTKDRVVGYGAWAFHELGHAITGPANTNFEARTKAILKEFGATFLKIAGASIEHGLAKHNLISVNLNSFPVILRETGACFVTLHKDNQLRGCIGSPEAHQPLIKDIAFNAYRAALEDPRFPPLQTNEISDIDLSISVLSPQSPMTIANEADLLKQLRPGTDGLVIGDSGKRALFLPSVWEQLPEPADFLNRLKVKAGMSAEHWSETFTAHRFITGDVKQSDLEDPTSIWPLISETPDKH
ncbi:MAG: AmmeMemoRadiSam system protein B [Rhodospirillales bacterium]|jgi:MEMO1 family protein|nr:AmmeMemoRadiSam system protein B [Rhodospirillales bacterium]MBT4628073.1 AmmeMemoRadiSam system protein B [Rhodospirillales bacterium]MBT5353398.1 AmmeMemoRadiSam system protein B [Rhodospirillales bacterium]MBT5521111.1 AmmeMemoRadiSam system protein B [Rhodospirillales bacterium]MBT6111448.1 AmmeMemoRadiSam system protein B [Rhodospirillales bacterium]